MLKIVPVIYIEKSCDEDEFEDERPAISEVCFEESDDPAPPFRGWLRSLNLIHPVSEIRTVLAHGGSKHADKGARSSI